MKSKIVYINIMRQEPFTCSDMLHDGLHEIFHPFSNKIYITYKAKIEGVCKVEKTGKESYS